MEFRPLLKETQEEAERKAIEAEGDRRLPADRQRRHHAEHALRWKGIEATQKLAGSPNSKVIIVGNSKDPLPVILGNE